MNPLRKLPLPWDDIDMLRQRQGRRSAGWVPWALGIGIVVLVLAAAHCVRAAEAVRGTLPCCGMAGGVTTAKEGAQALQLGQIFGDSFLPPTQPLIGSMGLVLPTKEVAPGMMLSYDEKTNIYSWVPQRWHLLIITHGGTVNLIHQLDERTCRYALARAKGEPATDEEKAVQAKREAEARARYDVTQEKQEKERKARINAWSDTHNDRDPEKVCNRLQERWRKESMPKVFNDEDGACAAAQPTVFTATNTGTGWVQASDVKRGECFQ